MPARLTPSALPFSEAQFKTLKYHPGFPSRFGGLEDALGFCRRFFPWYNEEHRHSGLVFLTPQAVHYGQAEEALGRRHTTMLAAYAAHPERFVHGPPRRAEVPRSVWINPPTDDEARRVVTGAGEPVTPTPAAAVVQKGALRP